MFINPFLPCVPLQFPRWTSENPRFSDVISGNQKETLSRNWLMQGLSVLYMLVNKSLLKILNKDNTTSIMETSYCYTEPILVNWGKLLTTKLLEFTSLKLTIKTEDTVDLAFCLSIFSKFHITFSRIYRIRNFVALYGAFIMHWINMRNLLVSV